MLGFRANSWGLSTMATSYGGDAKAGLDYSHQGIAFWGNDGKLHMLHASSERKRVIADERTLEDYLKRISHARGIRVFRIGN